MYRLTSLLNKIFLKKYTIEHTTSIWKPTDTNTALTDTHNTTDLFGSQNHSYDFEMKRPIYSVAAQDVVARGRPGVSDQEVSFTLQQSLCILQAPEWHQTLYSNTLQPNIVLRRANSSDWFISLLERRWWKTFEICITSQRFSTYTL